MWTAFLVAASSFHAASPIASLCEHLAKAPQECMTPARVLVLGDADFSHSCALVTALCCCPDQDVHLWTSCFESEDELLRKYPDAASNVVSLRSESRVQELSFGVDGRNIGQHYGRDLLFDQIVFNLPQAPVVPGSRNKIQRHRQLLRELCASAELALAPGGQLRIALLAGQGGTRLDPVQRRFGDTWQIQHAGASAGLLVRAATPVEADSLGYLPTGRRSNQRITPNSLRRGLVVHTLSREGEPAKPAACGPLEWCFQNSFILTAEEGGDGPPDGDSMHRWARAALDDTIVHALRGPPRLLRVRALGSVGTEGQVLTYALKWRSDEVALSYERVKGANAAACEAIAHASAGMQWTLGYPVRRDENDEDAASGPPPSPSPRSTTVPRRRTFAAATMLLASAVLGTPRRALASLASAAANGVPLVGRFAPLKGASAFVGSWRVHATNDGPSGTLIFLSDGDVELRDAPDGKLIGVSASPWTYQSTKKGEASLVRVQFSLDSDLTGCVLYLEGEVDASLGSERRLSGVVRSGTGRHVGEFKAEPLS
jgi:hypothetical protein